MRADKRDGKSRTIRRPPNRAGSSSGEFQLIDQLETSANRRAAGSRSLLTGIGDDAAVVRLLKGRDVVITCDMLVEDVDFRQKWMPPSMLGHKALAVSLSDIAAMGASPRFAIVSLGLPRKAWRSGFPAEFYKGFFALANKHEVTLVGGDLSRTTDHVVIDSIVIGEVAHDRAILRSGAQPGDKIFVTGSLGGAAAGLELLEHEARGSRRNARSVVERSPNELVTRQLLPTPRVSWGRTLAKKRLATAMIDLSDGLSSDLSHICRASGTGALIDAALIPIEPALAQSKEITADHLALAINGGEDFELLFTVRPDRVKKLPASVDGIAATCIGEITDAFQGIRLRNAGKTRVLKPQGFSHFKERV